MVAPDTLCFAASCVWLNLFDSQSWMISTRRARACSRMFPPGAGLGLALTAPRPILRGPRPSPWELTLPGEAFSTDLGRPRVACAALLGVEAGVSKAEDLPNIRS